MTAPTAEDVIARALVDDLCIRCIGRRHRLAAAVVAAIRAMTVAQQAELIGGTAERRSRSVYEGIYLADEQAEARPVGPWRAEP